MPAGSTKHCEDRCCRDRLTVKRYAKYGTDVGLDRHLTGSVLVGLLGFHTSGSSQAATLIQQVISINGTYQQTAALPAATAQTFRIITPNPSGVYYNVRIQVNQTAGHVGFYCNPSWGGQPQTGSNVAQSGNAVWQTDDAWFDSLTISANDASYLPTNSSTTSAILAGLSTSTSTYQPAFNCSAINPSVANAAVFTLTITFDANNNTLLPSEVEGLTTIYESCCSGATSCSAWKAKTTQLGEALYTNFCQFEGQYCTASGHLQQLDLTSYNMKCAFPISSLDLFPSMQTLILSSNPNVTTSLGSMMSVMANMQGLQHLELKGNIGISGPLADSSPSTSSGLCSVIQNGLQYLDFSNMDLTGSLPSCLLSVPGSIPFEFGAAMYMLQAVLLSDNNLTGTLPSPLATSISATYLDVSDNQLTALPPEWTAGFTNATQSSFVNIFLQQNQFQSPFPAAVAAFPDLLLFYANNNNLSGSLPNASHVFPQTRVLNVAYNNLTGSIPATFNTAGLFNASLGAVLTSPTTALSQVFNVSHNNLTGSVPSFLASSKVPTYTKQGISLVGNGIIANCGNSSFNYLDICDSLLNSTDVVLSPSPTLTPSATPAVTPTPTVAPSVAATPAATVALAPAVTQPATTMNGVATDSGKSPSASTSSSGVGSGAIAGIVLGVLAALVLGTVATALYIRQKRTHSRTLLRMQSSGGFSRFEDF
ncbi:hypothetical protein WJX79_006611 [Trebouxia sp. C0005]